MKISRFFGALSIAGGLVFATAAQGRDHHDSGNHWDRGHDWGHGHDWHHRGFYRGGGPFFGVGYYGSAFYDPWYYGAPAYGYYYEPAEPRVYDAERYGSLQMDVQLALTRRGYYRGVIDGDIGPASRAAIRAYQRDRGLPVTGRIDDPLMRALRV